MAPTLDPLSRLAIQHGTDKFGAHQYTPHYHRLFAARREMPVRLLEIGIGGYNMPLSGGQSLKMWADYFPYGRIVGLDIADKRMPMPPRVTMVQGSQIDTAFLDEVCAAHGPFDIIIDDGSHQVDHVLTTFHHLYPRMPEDGIYIVEDTQTAFWPNMGGRSKGAGSIFDLAHDVAVAMHALEELPSGTGSSTPYGEITTSVQILRNIIVFERGANRFPSNYSMRFDNSEAQAMWEALQSESARQPSSGTFVSRIHFAASAARADLALEAVREGLAAFPFDTELLVASIRVLDWVQRGGETLPLLERLKALFPDDATVTGMLEGRRNADVQS